MGDGKARVGLDARQALLRFVENIPRGPIGALNAL